MTARVVHRLGKVPAVRGRRVSPQERLRQLAEHGEIRLARRQRVPDFEPIRVRGRPVSQTLIKDRDR